MVKKINLNAVLRLGKSNTKEIRKKGSIPAVIYGADFATRSLVVKRADLEKTYHEAGESSLIDIIIGEEKPVKALIKDVQRNPLNEHIQHVDFYVVNMKKALEVEVPLHFIGESKAEKELGGYLVKNIEALKVKCLPTDLVDFIEVDISHLDTFADTVKVKDLNLSAGLEALYDPEEAVVHVIEPKVEEEVIAVPVETVLAEGEKAASEGEEKAEEKTEAKEKNG